jgi:hypothetical protein
MLADQLRPSYMSPNPGGGEGGFGVSANENSCASRDHGAQINFGDLTPFLTYPVSPWSLPEAVTILFACRISSPTDDGLPGCAAAARLVLPAASRS